MVIPPETTKQPDARPSIPSRDRIWIRVEYARFVGCNWSFLVTPRGRPLFTPNSASYLPMDFLKVSYRPGLDTPHHLDRYSNCSSMMLKKKYMARDPNISGFSGVARGFVLKNPVRQSLAGHRLRVTVGVFGDFFYC